jgi:hypothetical protein
METNNKKRTKRKKYYTKTHHPALRLCSSFPNNALQQLVPKITEHANSGDVEKRGKGGKEKGEEKKSSRKKSLADGKCISMIFLFSLEVFA